MNEEVRFLKLVNGEELIGKTNGVPDKDGFVRVENIIRIMILPPKDAGQQPLISFADYAPYAFPVGSEKNVKDRKAKWFRESEFLHPPMEVQDQLLKEYNSLFSPIVGAGGPKIIV